MTRPRSFMRPPRLLSIDEAAEVLRIGKTHLYSLISSGALPLVKLGASSRIREDDVLDVIESNTITRPGR